MALEINRSRFIFKTKEIWFSQHPYDVKGYHGVFFHECKDKVDISGFRREEFTTLTIDLTQDLDIIWKNIDKKSCQYGIKRAVREGIEVQLNKDFEQFFKLNRSFRKNKGLPVGDEKIETMREYGTLFTAHFNDEIIGGQLYLEDKENIRWLLGASKRLEVTKEKEVIIGFGNRLMIWEAIKYAKNKGLREFDLGGFYTGRTEDSQKEGINVFKKSFGGILVNHYTYRKDYSRILSLARWIYQLKSR